MLIRNDDWLQVKHRFNDGELKAIVDAMEREHHEGTRESYGFVISTNKLDNKTLVKLVSLLQSL